MLDRAGGSNELFRFSTTDLQWEQLDATRVSGWTRVSVGRDLYGVGGVVSMGWERVLGGVDE